jgi:hypothetical protein
MSPARLITELHFAISDLIYASNHSGVLATLEPLIVEYSGTPDSATVGTWGKAGERRVLVTASARALPASTEVIRITNAHTRDAVQLRTPDSFARSQHGQHVHHINSTCEIDQMLGINAGSGSHQEIRLEVERFESFSCFKCVRL